MDAAEKGFEREIVAAEIRPAALLEVTGWGCIVQGARAVHPLRRFPRRRNHLLHQKTLLAPAAVAFLDG